MINLQLKETVWFEWLFSSCRCSSHPRHHPPRRCWACWSAGRTQTRRSAWRQSPWRETCSGAAGRESLPRHRTDRGDQCRCRRCYTHRPAELRTEPRVTVCQIKSQMDLKGPLNQMTADCWGFQIIELFLLKLLTALWDDAEKQFLEKGPTNLEKYNLHVRMKWDSFIRHLAQSTFLASNTDWLK